MDSKLKLRFFPELSDKQSKQFVQRCSGSKSLAWTIPISPSAKPYEKNRTFVV